MGSSEDISFLSDPESAVPVQASRADSQSDVSEEVLVPAAESQPALLEDPLVLNSPRISIPNKHQAVFKPNKLPQCEKFPTVSRSLLKIVIVMWKNRKQSYVSNITDHFEP